MEFIAKVWTGQREGDCRLQVSRFGAAIIALAVKAQAIDIGAGGEIQLTDAIAEEISSGARM